MNRILLNSQEFNDCLAILKIEFMSQERYKNIGHQKLHNRLKLRMEEIVRTQYPQSDVVIEVDTNDIEHPKVTMHQLHVQHKKPSNPRSTKYEEMKQYLQDRYGKSVGLFLCNRLAKMIRKRGLQDSCVIDNLRIARVGYTSHELAYSEAKKNGCCGFADEVFEYKSKSVLGKLFGVKTQWKIGFNYGH